MALPTTSAELRAKGVPQAPVDASVTLPKAIRDQIARAEVIQQAIQPPSEPNGQTPPNGQQPPPQPELHTPTGQPGEPPAQVQPQAPPDGQAPAPGQPDQPVDWERNFNAMKGRYDHLAAQVQPMSERLRTLETENATLRNQPPVAPPLPNGSLITEQEMQEYGPEFVDLVRRAAAEIAAPLQAEVRDLRGQLGSVQQETGNSFLTRMNATIAGLVPNWQALNAHPSFIQWTQLPDVFSGAIRGQLMQEAWNAGDAQRVAAFFRAFLAEEAAVDPTRSAQPHMPGSPVPPAAMHAPGGLPGTSLQTRLSLDTLVAPGRAHSAAQQPADKPVYTAADITRFYTDVAAGKWRTRDAERAAIDADIIAAQREGRIIPDQRTMQPHGWSGGR